MADTNGFIDPDNALVPLQAVSSTYRIAMEPRAGRKVLTLQYAPRRVATIIQQLCANAHGFSLHAGVRCAACVCSSGCSILTLSAACVAAN